MKSCLSGIVDVGVDVLGRSMMTQQLSGSGDWRSEFVDVGVNVVRAPNEVPLSSPRLPVYYVKLNLFKQITIFR